MKLKASLEALERSKAYADWDKGDYYLVHFFHMTGHPAQFGYYNSSTKKMICFEMREEPVMLPESDVFREDDSPLKALDAGQVFIDIHDAMNNARKLAQEKYPHETVDKDITVLQNTDDGYTYTITLVTKSIRMINIKMSAESGEVRNYEMHSLMDLGDPLA
jgi:hypothetical protein